MSALPREASIEPQYDHDFYSWAILQARLLREGRFGQLDIANIAEEIETLGRSERSALRSHYAILALHLLKLVHQPEMQSKSWFFSIVNARNEIRRLILENPGLKPQRETLFQEGYEDARRLAAVETGLAQRELPATAPFSRDQAEDADFLPNAG